MVGGKACKKCSSESRDLARPGGKNGCLQVQREKLLKTCVAAFSRLRGRHRPPRAGGEAAPAWSISRFFFGGGVLVWAVAPDPEWPCANEALDKSVAEATEMRKEESAEYQELMANNKAAKDAGRLPPRAKKRHRGFTSPRRRIRLFREKSGQMASGLSWPGILCFVWTATTSGEIGDRPETTMTYPISQLELRQ